MKRGMALVAALGLLSGDLVTRATAQIADEDPIQWSAAIRAQPSSSGGNATLQLSGSLKPGWHVYAEHQAPEGPTPLKISIPTAALAHIRGATSGTAPEKAFDRSFGLETQFFTGDFVIDLPLQLSVDPRGGGFEVPVSIRFQTCNGEECRPPKTVQLQARLDASARESQDSR